MARNAPVVDDVGAASTTRLQASRDLKTGHGVFPRVPFTSPAADRYEPIELSPSGRLYSHTVIHPNPKSGLQPFVLAYVDFPEDARVFGRLILPAGERPVIGSAVRVVTGDGAGSEAYCFQPVEGDQR